MNLPAQIQAGRFVLGALFLLAATTLAPSPATAQAQGAPPAEPEILEARRLRDSGQIVEAANAYQNFIRTHPEAWLARYEFAQILIAMDYLEGAQQHLQAALLTSPTQAMVWARLGQVLLLRGDMENAERALSRARELDPSDASVRYNLGRLYEQQGREEEALREYQDFLEHGADDSHALAVRRKLAVHFENTKQNDKAIEQYRYLVEADPKNIPLRHVFSELLYKGARYDEALAHYRVLVELDPNDGPSHFNIGFIAKMKGNLDEAEIYLRKAVALNAGSAKAHYQLGAVQFEKADYPGAATSFEAAVALDPEHPQAHYHLARTYAKLGRSEDAARQMALHREVVKKIDEKKPPMTMDRETDERP